MSVAEHEGNYDTSNILARCIRFLDGNKLPKLAAIAVLLMGMSTLAGWAFSIPLLKSILPGAVEMKANTALCLVLSACSLFILVNAPTSLQLHAAQAAALMVAAIGVATLGEYLFGWQLGIDELLFRDTADAYNVIRGRMSPYSTVTFAMVGLGLAALPMRSLRPLTLALSIPVIAVGTLSCIGYLWNATEIITDQVLPPVAVNTAIAFVMLGLGMLQLSWMSWKRYTARNPVEIRILAGFVISLVLLLMAAGYTYRAGASYVDASQWVNHTEQVRVVLRRLYSSISDAESMQRGYLLTGDVIYREEYRRIAGDLETDGNNLARLVSDNPSQMANLVALTQLIERRVGLLEKHLTAFEHQGHAIARAAIVNDNGIQTMQSLRKLIDHMDETEAQLLGKRESTLVHDRAVTLNALMAMLLVATGMLTSLFWGIRRENLARAAAEQQLRASEENLSVTLNSIGDAVLATDAEGRVTRLNEVAVQLTGWSQAEAIGLPVSGIFNIVNQKTRQPAVIPVVAALSQGVVQGLANDTVLISRDGSERPIADSCAPIRNRNGEVIGAVLVFRDVSREYASRAALRDSSTRIQTILNTVGDGIISNNEQGIIESFNPAAERIFGYSASEAIGLHVSMLMAEQDRLQHSGNFRDEIGFRREVGGRRKDGSEFPLELTVSEMYLGERRLFTAIVRDITERREAENRLDLFFSLSLDMLCIASGDGYFKRISPAFTQVLGWSNEELLARPFLEFVHPDDHAATLREVERQVAAGEKVLSFENRYLHKDGSWRILSWKSAPHGDGLMFATARDVTARKQAERELVAAMEKAELANRAKDSFLATMSHEIRTPLTGMLGMLELLSLSKLDDEQRKTLDVAWESGRGLLRIVSDILDWSKIEEGKLELSLHATSIPHLLHEVVNTYSRVASAKNLILRQHADERLSSAHIVDPLRLSQVLNNFVSNAIKFTPSGEVELRADLVEQHESGERIRFSVRDTGIGIDRKVQKLLFRRYRQESSDTARMYGGTGLGLAICQRLAEMMDGQIGLESEPGRGAVFNITLVLPVSAATEDEVRIDHPEVEQRTVRPLLTGDSEDQAPLVLAVDDHPINRDLLARQISMLGLKVETAENGLTALSKWRTGRFALVVTDCHMPEMDGYELAQAIRRVEIERRLARTPVIAWTANALAEEAEHCRAAGMDELLVKPASLAQLRKALAQWLNMDEPESDAPDSRVGTGLDCSSEPVDITELEKVVPDSSEHLEVLRDFQSQIRKDLAMLHELIDRNDLFDTERTAHRIKGSCRMVGAKDMALASAAIEQAARDGNIATAARVAEGCLDTAMERFDHFLLQLESGGKAHDNE